MKILGIDNGLSGALALWCDGRWVLLDTPIVSNGKRNELNGPEICRWLREHAPHHAFLEFASARPGQGVTSMFRYGVCYGMMQAALAACGVPFSIVTPQRWKSAVGIPTGADKAAGRLRALQLFPNEAAHLARKKDHARADAMLLAYYGVTFGQFGKGAEQEREDLAHEKHAADVREALDSEFGK